jgi:Fe-S-cluster containining protein
VTDGTTPPEKSPDQSMATEAAGQTELGAIDEPLEQRLARGLQFADMLGFTNQQDLRENRVLLQALAELLVAKGILRLHELEERKKEVAGYFEQRDQGPKVHLVTTEDKYAPQMPVPVDCENRIHLCKASCCKLWFALSVQDLEERIVRWNYAQPYAIAQGKSGYCVHQEGTGAHCCGVYENRPLICRTYTCRDDKRIWLDFEGRVVNPDILRPGWPEPAAADGETKAVEPAAKLKPAEV